ncbi:MULTISPECIES: diguanylate cyclase [unclassified Oceanispirochaeta]|uniref:diguanylate cyclase n=1 Tax=unclassified Oceanispirochaeta TaxID=2635722 RepID=UPI000E09463E|nr:MULTISPECIES: diguanylate cyclase [unclassified Oceanispirochaeta]MBF9015727.1 diguanylate cyclase [Oceanispirochaeta sp. M2]NPD72192.1 diguanylate cyclase [Oceanispirochaeta sp. M1]RDG32292.1 sensor domain-containing diguanylate cyclase [Oceanispirochaeta sp. M1]
MENYLKKIKVRRFFYTAFLLILILQSFYFSFLYLSNLKRSYSERVDQIQADILNEKKIQVKVIVEAKLTEIIQSEKFMIHQYDDKAKVLGTAISTYFERGIPVENISENLGWFPSDIWSYQIIDNELEIVLHSSYATDEKTINQGEWITSYSTRVSDRYEIIVFLTPSVFNEIFIQQVRSTIYAAQLPEGGYIWINNILNYDGGQDYAIRLIHPNLPETEGSFLSTESKDIKGNPFYLTELEGIRDSGEIFNEYYFKKLDSDLIIRKLSYAKLYKKYNWVIATGISLNDLDNSIYLEKLKMDDKFKRRIIEFIIISMASIILSIGIIIIFEKKISKLINRYSEKLKDEKDKLTLAYNQLKEIAYLDSLTGLVNRRAMFQHLEKELSLYKREQRDFCIILSDVDKFKTVNDRYGHNSGDYILHELAIIMKENVREEDVVSRWGGEEFLILISGGTLEKGALVAEKLRKAIEEHSFQADEIFIPVTLTFGVSSSKKNQDLKDLIREADEKLYKGKRSTRNCVVS